jgi:hypothetical protein
MGVLVADVSGKGTSAALYMAELKGLVLSLSRIYDSPKRLLAEANRILSANMDARSFVTMTTRWSTRRRGACATRGPATIPDPPRRPRTGTQRDPGAGRAGPRLDAGERFEAILEESEVPLESATSSCSSPTGSRRR